MKTRKIDVLNHGFVRLVSSMGDDLSVVRNARVSFDAEWRTGEDGEGDEKLINYLYKHRHNTPFESVVFTFDVKAPIFVLRQWMRHRTQSYNELSARYKEVSSQYYIPDIDKIGKQSKINKQCRDLDDALNDRDLSAKVATKMRKVMGDSFAAYKELIAMGVPRELARVVTPLGSYSHMFTTVNLHNLFGFLRERLHQSAQYEIRVYAEAMLKLIEPIVPVCVSAFKEGLK